MDHSGLKFFPVRTPSPFAVTIQALCGASVMRRLTSRNCSTLHSIGTALCMLPKASRSENEAGRPGTEMKESAMMPPSAVRYSSDGPHLREIPAGAADADPCDAYAVAEAPVLAPDGCASGNRSALVRRWIARLKRLRSVNALGEGDAFKTRTGRWARIGIRKPNLARRGATWRQ